MSRKIEATGRKVEDAIEEGLKTLGVTLDEVDVKIISSGGLFKKAKVELTTNVGAKKSAKTETQATASEPKSEIKEKTKQEPIIKKEKKESKSQENKSEKKVSAKEKTDTQQVARKRENEKPQSKVANKPNPSKMDSVSQKPSPEKSRNQERRPEREETIATEEDLEKAKSFLKQLLEKMGLDSEITVKSDDGIELIIETEDSVVIGHRGETLDALQYLTSLAVNGDSKRYLRINVDALNYREKRVETLKRIASKTAERSLKYGKKMFLEPMNSAERRVIHAHLSENESVNTKSEGYEPNRRVVIYPKKNAVNQKVEGK